MFFPFRLILGHFLRLPAYIRSNEMMYETGLVSTTVPCKKKALPLSTNGLRSYFLQKKLGGFPHYVSVYLLLLSCSFLYLYVTVNHLLERTLNPVSQFYQVFFLVDSLEPKTSRFSV